MIKRNWRQLATTLLLVGLIGVLSVYLVQDRLSTLLVHHTHIAVSKDTVTKAEKKPVSQVSYNFEEVAPLSLASLSAAAVKQHNIAAVGKLVIPEVDLNLPIALGVDNATLAFAAGTLNDNQRMGQGNYALAGHHMAEDERVLFGPLVKSSVGMVAYVTDMSEVYAYQIYARKYIKATDVGIIGATAGPELTLITCDDDGVGRLSIQAKLIATVPVEKTPTSLRKLIDEQ